MEHFLDVYSVKPFRRDSGLSLTLAAERSAGGRRELSQVVHAIEQFYVRETNSLDTKVSKSKDVEGGAIVYHVRGGSRKEYIGAVKVAPQRPFTKRAPVDRREDFAVGDRNTYGETYWIDFYPADKTQRREHRDGFVEFVDPTGEKTRES